MGYLDNTGLAYLWGKITSIFTPNTRTVNSKALTSDITLDGSDIPVTTNSQTTIDAAIDSCIKTVNGTGPDSNGNVEVETSGVPESHAASTTVYGGGTSSLYGHVKLSDTYSSQVSNGAADNSLGASQNAVYNAYNTLNSGKAPTSHASTATTYGVGSTSNYGHVKTINALTQSSHSDGTALSAYQGYVLNNSISGKAPTSHASTATTYGLGTTSNYGHVKTINALTQSSHSDGTALSAYQGYLLNNNKARKLITKSLNVSAATSSTTIGTLSDSAITAAMVVLSYVISAPAYQTSDWTVTTAAGSLTITGTCFAATSVTLVLGEV